MKKRMVLAITLVCGLFLSTGTSFAGYLVIGAGNEDVDGLYCETDETSFGKTVYIKEGSDFAIKYRETGSITIIKLWEIVKEGVVGAIYGNPSDSPFPPLTSWVAGRIDLSKEPPPYLREQSCEPEPEPVPSVNQWGFIIFGVLLAGSAVWFIRRHKAEL